MRDKIEFPLDEHEAYKKRLDQNKTIYTTRISDEVGKYALNEVYSSPFGELKVISIEHFDTIFEHPFYRELTSEQIGEIEKFTDDRGIDLIELRKN